jgi:glycosyltransferase involved in cell wall biosynthesis
MEHSLTVCYFGIYNPEFSRNKIYISGLRSLGVNVVECRDDSSGFSKFWKLWKKHRQLNDQYSVLIVGYPGHVVTPLARLISRKTVILDALGTLHEAEVLSHNAGFFGAIKARIIDWLAVKCAHAVLVESEPQRHYFEKRFGASDKYRVVHTGAREGKRERREEKAGKTGFKVLFRGSLTPEAGLETILQAAAILEKSYPDENISFSIFGRGICEQEVVQLIQKLALHTVEFETAKLPWEELVERMQECSVALGQFSTNPRLQWTIPHKAFEAMALRIPYVTACAEGISSVFVEGKHCLMVTPADPDDLVAKILELKRAPALRAHLADAAYAEYLEKYTPTALGRKLIEVVTEHASIHTS